MPQMSPLMWEILFIVSTLGAVITASKNYFYLEASIKSNKMFSMENKKYNTWMW